MANVLNEALPHIQGLLTNQNIKILQKSKVLVNGFPKTETIELNATAHIQPLTPFAMQKLGDSLFNSQKAFKFYILGNLAEVASFLDNADSLIIWNGVEYSAFSKTDYSQNGWIQVIATPAQKVENV